MNINLVTKYYTNEDDIYSIEENTHSVDIDEGFIRESFTITDYDENDDEYERLMTLDEISDEYSYENWSDVVYEILENENYINEMKSFYKNKNMDTHFFALDSISFELDNEDYNLIFSELDGYSETELAQIYNEDGVKRLYS